MTTEASPYQWRLRIDALVDPDGDYEWAFRVLDLLLMYRHQAEGSPSADAADSARIEHLQAVLTERLDDHDRADVRAARHTNNQSDHQGARNDTRS